MIQAIILIGGKGTRLSQIFPDRPKALVPVAGQPFLERQLAWLRRNGITHIHLAAGHLAGAMQDWLVQEEIRGQRAGDRDQRSEVRDRPGKNRKKSDANQSLVFHVKAPIYSDSPADSCSLTSDLIITCSIEPQPLGTGGGLKFVEQHIRSDPFLVLNGDTILPQLDFTSFQKAHEQARPLVSIAVTQIQKTGRYGTIEFDHNQRILAFHEKSERAEGWVNGGVYLMDKNMLPLLEPGKRISLETETFPMLAAQEKMRAYPVPPPLLDMGTPDGLAGMEHFFQIKDNKSTP